MIEVLSADRCVACDICVAVCPTDVFDPVPGSAPVVARLDDCQTCFQCEAYCPAEAIFVAPLRVRAAQDSPWRDEQTLAETGALGSYRVAMGWRRGATRVGRRPDQVVALDVSSSVIASPPEAPR